MSSRKLIDLTDERFGKWLVLRFAHRGLRGVAYWLCRCDCGVEKTIRGSAMAAGKSAGCASCSNGRTTHGHTRNRQQPREYHSWSGMNQRCNNPTDHGFHNYGGRGIKLCKRWRGRSGYANFIADLGSCPRGKSLERIDVNGNYEPSNCRWATVQEQCRNRRNSRKVTCAGRTQNIVDWADELKIDRRVLHYLLVPRGWKMAYRNKHIVLISP